MKVVSWSFNFDINTVIIFLLLLLILGVVVYYTLKIGKLETQIEELDEKRKHKQYIKHLKRQNKKRIARAKRHNKRGTINDD